MSYRCFGGVGEFDVGIPLNSNNFNDTFFTSMQRISLGFGVRETCGAALSKVKLLFVCLSGVRRIKMKGFSVVISIGMFLVLSI